MANNKGLLSVSALLPPGPWLPLEEMLPKACCSWNRQLAGGSKGYLSLEPCGSFFPVSQLLYLAAPQGVLFCISMPYLNWQESGSPVPSPLSLLFCLPSAPSLWQDRLTEVPQVILWMSQKAKGSWVAVSGKRPGYEGNAREQAFCRSSPASEWTQAWRVSVEGMPHLHCCFCLFVCFCPGHSWKAIGSHRWNE